jgi:CRP-like cAMP-binding protein
MMTADRLRQIAFWAEDLNETEIEHARRGMTEKDVAKGEYLCHRGDRLDVWVGMIGGIIKLGTVSSSGKSTTLAGCRAGSWKARCSRTSRAATTSSHCATRASR